MSSQVARLKAQLDAKTKFGPEHHHHKARTQAEKERIQVETAKKMAARFNLTYRALALSAAKKAAENRQKELEAAKQAKEAAAKYQMTARALKMSATGTAKGRVDVLTKATTPVKSAPTAAAKPQPSPVTLTTLADLAVQQNSQPEVDHEELEMLRATRPSDSDGREEDDEVGSLVSKKREDDEGSVMIDDSKFDTMSRITEITREHEHEEHDAFWMPTLASALVVGDDSAINLAVVKSFFEEHDPTRIEEAAELLEAHKGREEQLMEALNEQYPPITDVQDLIEEPAKAPAPETVKMEQVTRPSSLGRVKSARVTGLTLSVKLDDGISVPTLEASLQQGGETGYILSGVRPDRRSHKFLVNSVDAEQQKTLREKMAKIGVNSDVIDAVVGDSSEML